MQNNPVKTKSYEFAVRIVNMYKHLSKEKKEFVLSKQVLRSGTSIGANVAEALGGSSRADFVNRMNISYKETRETLYWLNLLYDTGFIGKPAYQSIRKDCDELARILFSIINTSRKSIKKK